MRKVHTIFKVLLFCSFALGFVSVVQGQSIRTWVSGTGDDTNPCSRSQPCSTFSGAISKTAVNGEINCLTPGGFGAVTITKSITIDCHEVFAGANHSATQGVLINYDSFAGTDVRKSVRLRNINYQGSDTGTRGVRIIGGSGSAGSKVHVQDCLIDGNFGSIGRGIEDTRSGGGSLLVTNTTIRNLSGTAISHAPPAGAARIDVAIDNVRIFNCLFGVAVGNGGNMVITNSVIASCVNAGLFAEGPLVASTLHANNVVLNDNGIGIQQTSGGTIRVGNSEITNSTTNGTSGTVNSYGNNRVAGNAGVTTLTPVGLDSHDKGQQ
jgi:hypothetical protein